MCQPVIFVRGAVEAVKCSLNLHLLFKKPNVLHIGYMQQKRKVHNEFNFFFLKLYYGQLIEKEQPCEENAVLFYMPEAKI